MSGVCVAKQIHWPIHRFAAWNDTEEHGDETQKNIRNSSSTRNNTEHFWLVPLRTMSFVLSCLSFVTAFLSITPSGFSSFSPFPTRPNCQIGDTDTIWSLAIGSQCQKSAKKIILFANLSDSASLETLYHWQLERSVLPPDCRCLIHVKNSNCGCVSKPQLFCLA